MKKKWALLIIFFLCLDGYAREYYVSVKGNDSNPGTIEKPFRTITKAASMMKIGDVCYVREGTYRESIRLRNISSFNEIWTRFIAYPGETVVFNGTEPIQGEWSVYKEKIYKIQVDLDFNQLFVDGKMMTEARWPNCPFEKRWDVDCWSVVKEGSIYGKIVDPELSKTDIDWTGAIATLNISGFQCWTRFVQNHRKGQNYFEYSKDLGANMEGRGPRHTVGRCYFLSGKLEALDSPGEWFLDRENKVLYLWLPDDNPPEEHRVEVKVRDYAFDVYHCNNIEIKGFHFFATTLKMVECGYCVVDNCHFIFPTYARLLKKNEVHQPVGSAYVDKISCYFKNIRTLPPTFVSGPHNTIKNCSISYSDGPGLVVEGWDNVVENCLIHDVGWRSFTPASGIESNTSDVILRYNTIFNTGNVPIRASGGTGKKIIEYNHVHHGGMNTTDGACVQTGGIDAVGTIIRYNWAHDYVAFFKKEGGGGKGLRGDDLTRGLTVHHNVVWNCKSQGIIVKGDHNRVYNNTVFDIEKTDILLPRRPEPFKPWNPNQWPYLLKKQNAHSEIINNYANIISGRFDSEPVQEPPLGKIENNYQGKNLELIDPEHFDFRPRPDSPLIDAGQFIPGITDKFCGLAPDIGAYEYGQEYWIPGHQNLLWIIPNERKNEIKVLLAMPIMETVTVCFLGTKKHLKFTPENWMKPYKVQTEKSFVIEIPEVNFSKKINLEAMDSFWGKKIPFPVFKIRSDEK